MSDCSYVTMQMLSSVLLSVHDDKNGLSSPGLPHGERRKLSVARS